MSHLRCINDKKWKVFVIKQPVNGWHSFIWACFMIFCLVGHFLLFFEFNILCVLFLCLPLVSRGWICSQENASESLPSGSAQQKPPFWNICQYYRVQRSLQRKEGCTHSCAPELGYKTAEVLNCSLLTWSVCVMWFKWFRFFHNIT